jgi:hypothetical protein
MVQVLGMDLLDMDLVGMDLVGMGLVGMDQVDIQVEEEVVVVVGEGVEEEDKVVNI